MSTLSRFSVLAIVFATWFMGSSQAGSLESGSAPCPDGDLDGYADCEVAGCDDSGVLCGDCDDSNASIRPDAQETCNHRDDDCNSTVDDGMALPVSATLFDPEGDSGDLFGSDVDGLGDVTGDGVPDLAVGVRSDDTAQGSSAGSVLIFSGSDRSVVCRATDPSGSANANLGRSVAGLPDLTGDGVPDLVAGAAASPASLGSVSIFSGATCAFVRKCTPPAGSPIGFAVAGLADITGDGLPEVLAGSAGDDTPQGADAGSVVVFSGADCSVVHELQDPQGASNDYLGNAVAGLVDVTGDGIADIAAGAMRDDTTHADAGSVSIFSGADGAFVRKLVRPQGTGIGDFLGSSVTGGADFDGDGVEDIIAGAPGDNTSHEDAGSLFVFSGADGSLLRFCEGTGIGDKVGASVQATEDVTGDSMPEIVAGVPLDWFHSPTVNWDYPGSVRVLSGSDCSEIEERVDPDADPDIPAFDSFGYSVVNAGDLSGDGVPDVVAGAPGADGAAGEAQGGRVLIFAWDSDCDGDGVVPFHGDCTDDDPESTAPGPITGLRFTSESAIHWDAAALVPSYDVVKGDLAQLGANGGDFTASLLECLEEDSADAEASDTDQPLSGQGFYYLVRGFGCTQNGTFDSGSPSQLASRDGGIAESPASCL